MTKQEFIKLKKEEKLSTIKFHEKKIKSYENGIDLLEREIIELDNMSDEDILKGINSLEDNLKQEDDEEKYIMEMLKKTGMTLEELDNADYDLL